MSFKRATFICCLTQSLALWKQSCLFVWNEGTFPEPLLHDSSGDSNENKPLVGAEEEEVAKMGCPSLGEHKQLEVIIEESYEFKVTKNVWRLT